jgi:hypothetical protein
MYEDTVECKKYADKVKKAQQDGKTVRKLQPNEGKIPEGYINLQPIAEAAMKKAVLPSLPINLFDLGRRHSKVLAGTPTPMVINSRGYNTLLIGGDKLKRLDELPGEGLAKDIYVASTCFIIQAKEFSYSGGTKRALKLILDADGYVSEKVLWPEYETGKLLYPETLKKGAIATVFFRKKVDKKDLSIVSVVVET